MKPNMTYEREELATVLKWVIRRCEVEQNKTIRRSISGTQADSRPNYRKAVEESLEEMYAVLSRFDLNDTEQT